MVSLEKETHERRSDVSCIFCSMPQEDREYLGTNLFYGSFDNFPVSPGHLIIVPKYHIVDLQSLTAREWSELFISIQNGINVIETTNLEQLYRKKIQAHLNDESVWFCQKALAHPQSHQKPDSYNHGINDGKTAGRTVHHFHWHIIPRYEGDVVDPRGGVRYVIPELGNYKVHRE